MSSWTEEDWLIIDSTLNSIAKSLHRIEREEKKRKKWDEHKVIPVPLPCHVVSLPQDECVEKRSENL